MERTASREDGDDITAVSGLLYTSVYADHEDADGDVHAAYRGAGTNGTRSFGERRMERPMQPLLKKGRDLAENRV